MLNYDGESLGKIENLMINISRGEVEYAVIDFRSFLGIGGKLFAVPFKELQIKPDDKFVLDRDVEL